MRAFYESDGDGFRATELTRGPWDDRFQHGGPPAALVVGQLARFGEQASQMAVSRITVELLRPVPIARLEVELAVEREGRTAERLIGRLLADGRCVLEARMLRLRRASLDVVEDPGPDWPEPEASQPFVFPFFRHEVGYHRAVELRVAHGSWGGTPVGFWARPVVELLDDRPTTPLERLLVLADAQSGMGVPLDPMAFSFVNPDLTVYLERPPEGEWFGFDIRSTAGRHGVGLAQSAVRDCRGLVARSAQALVVRPR